MDTDTVSLPFRTPLSARDPLSFCRRRRHRRRSASLVVISLSLSNSFSICWKETRKKRERRTRKRRSQLGVGGGGRGGKEPWLVRVVQWRLYRVSKTFGKLVSYHLQVHFGYFFSLLENWSWMACLLDPPPPPGFFMVAVYTGVSWLTDCLC